MSKSSEVSVPRLLSPADLSAFLGVPVKTVYRWTSARDGSGPQFMRVGKHIRFAIDDVAAWQRSRIVPQRGDATYVSTSARVK